MRERAATTIVMWIAVAVSIDRILASLKYEQWVPFAPGGDPGNGAFQIMLVSEGWQIGAAILIFLLVIAAAIGTGAIWGHTSASSEAQTQARQSEKAKRDNREARIKRLVASLDDEELDALESQRLENERFADDGERQSLEALLKKRA